MMKNDFGVFFNEIFISIPHSLTIMCSTHLHPAISPDENSTFWTISDWVQSIILTRKKNYKPVTNFPFICSENSEMADRKSSLSVFSTPTEKRGIRWRMRGRSTKAKSRSGQKIYWIFS